MKEFSLKSSSSPLVLCIDKPPGPSSFDIIRQLKKGALSQEKKIGHFGTLDPFASGLLLIGLGRATRAMDYIHRDTHKTYELIGKLGQRTDTGDLTGTFEAPCPDLSEIETKCKKLSIAELEKNFRDRFLGEYLQSPPAYSASKHKGKPLYEWAREGKKIEKEKKTRHLFSIDILDFSFPFLKMRVCVSTGTYIRVLFEDFAKVLGTSGYLEELRRTAIGPLNVENAFSVEDVQAKETWKDCAFRVDSLLSFPRIILPFDDAARYQQGQRLKQEDSIGKDGYRIIFGPDDSLLGFGEQAKGLLVPRLNFS